MKTRKELQAEYYAKGFESATKKYKEQIDFWLLHNSPPKAAETEQIEKMVEKRTGCPKCGSDEENHKRMGYHVYCCNCEYEWNWG